MDDEPASLGNNFNLKGTVLTFQIIYVMRKPYYVDVFNDVGNKIRLTWDEFRVMATDLRALRDNMLAEVTGKGG